MSARSEQKVNEAVRRVRLAMVAGEKYGSSDVWRLTGLRSRRVYQALDWLEAHGEVTSWWGEPAKPGKPQRRYYMRP